MVKFKKPLAMKNTILKESTPFYIDVLGFRRDFGDGSEGWSFLSRDNFKGSSASALRMAIESGSASQYWPAKDNFRIDVSRGVGIS